MIHLGDITKINGAEIEPVDCITGGSPCQDLSVAGKRAGLAGERSGLFMEQIRVIKEMRQHEKECGRADEFIRPRWMVWENVPGAFSSNDGEDFRAVLEETARIVDETAVIPRPPKGKWASAGCIMGDGWSIAWRVHDAQFWGVPQRRKRIALVADFGGTTAPEILFERKGVSGDSEQSGTARQGAAGDSERGTGEAGTICLNDQGGSVMSVSEEVGGTLRAQEHGHQPVVYGIGSYHSNAMMSDNPHSGIYEAETARTLDLRGGDPTCHQGGMAIVEDSQSYGFPLGFRAENTKCYEEKATTLCNGTRPGYTAGVVGTYDVRISSDGTKNWRAHAYETDRCRALDTGGENPDSNHGVIAVVALENHPNDSRVKISEDGIVQTLSGRMGTGGGNTPMVMESMAFSDVAACRSAQDGRGAVHSQMMSDPEGNFVLGPVTASKASFFTNANSTGTAETLVATDYKDPQIVAYGMDRAAYNQGANAKFDFSVDEEKVETCVAQGPGAVCARDYKGVGAQDNDKLVVGSLCARDYKGGMSVVRRLTPLECERLQGFPDGWTDIGDWTDSKGKLHKGDSDSPRYKALGNSIALPFWFYLLRRISATYERPATLGSLFDGIGGFPLCWETCNGKGTARWASEIEEFPIAVTKKHFKEDTQ